MTCATCPRYGFLHKEGDCERCKYLKEEYTDEEATLIHVFCGVVDYLNFGDFCRNEMGMQSQYGYYLFEGLANHPELGTGLRVVGDRDMYHTWLIHKEDAPIFKHRYLTWRNR